MSPRNGPIARIAPKRGRDPTMTMQETITGHGGRCEASRLRPMATTGHKRRMNHAELRG